jgi:hypothetical protein
MRLQPCKFPMKQGTSLLLKGFSVSCVVLLRPSLVLTLPVPPLACRVPTAPRHYPYQPISTNNAFLDVQSSCFWNIQYLKELTCLATTGRGARPSILSTRLTFLSILTSIIDMSSPYPHKFQICC